MKKREQCIHRAMLLISLVGLLMARPASAANECDFKDGQVVAQLGGTSANDADTNAKEALVLPGETLGLLILEAPGDIRTQEAGTALLRACLQSTKPPRVPTLYLQHTALEKIQARAAPDGSGIQFDLRFLPEDTALWQSVQRFQSPPGGPTIGLGDDLKEWGFSRSVYVSSDAKLSGDPKKFKLLAYPDSRLGTAWACFGIILAVILFIGWRSNAARDRSFDLSQTPANPTASLSRSQLLVLSATFFATTSLLWVLTGNLVAPNGKTLLLLGISVGTAAAGIAVDSSKQKPAATSSGNVLVDMVSGSGGVEIHRLQAVIATLVVAFYFAYQAFQSLAFPDIDNGWLALLGLSGGTFVGLKMNEK